MGWLLLLLVGIGPVPSSSPPLATGIALYYDTDSTFRGVLRVRHMIDRRGLYGITGLASTKRCRRVDTDADPTLQADPWLVLISLWDAPRQQWTAARILQVGDCSAPADVDRHTAMGLMVEVDPATAKNAHFYGVGRTAVRVLDFWRYSDWKARVP